MLVLRSWFQGLEGLILGQKGVIKGLKPDYRLGRPDFGLRGLF